MIMKVNVAKSEDLKTINEWRRGWGIPEVPPHMLPKGGFIIPDMAAGFCYLTDSSLAIVEEYVRNPSITSEEANKAIDAITVAILSYAKRHECSVLMAFATRQEVGDRAERHGFSPCGGYLGYVKEIKKWDS